MPYNASADLWYLHFTRDDANQALILGSFVAARAMLATIGILFNAATVYITFCSKSLHGLCSILIALDCFFSTILFANFYVSLFITLSGIRFIRYEQCFLLIILPVLCGNLAQLVMVFTGIDRLLGVFFPIWYHKRKMLYFLFIYGLLLIVHVVFDFLAKYVDYLQSGDVMVMCSSNDSVQTEQYVSIMKIKNLMMSGLLMCIYGLIWIVVFFVKSIRNAVGENSRRLIGSLIIIIFLNLFGVFVRSSVNLYFNYYGSPNIYVKRALSDVLAVFVIIVYSANAPVLYFMSKAYRDKFNEHFAWLKRIFPERTVQNSQQFPTSSINRSNPPTINNFIVLS